ncbi:MAG: hypothetical protein GX362_05655 [Methanosarcinaceae archaeon]|nr:hypothetical protein [Methanosarcinaceae archaeon]
MLITSSRKPSSGTKQLCKKLALFFDCKYIARGKSSIEDIIQSGLGDVILIVGEYHGNPGSLTFYDEFGNVKISFLISSTYPNNISDKQIRTGLLDIEGFGEAANILSNLLLNLPPVEKSENIEGRVLRVTPDKIEFLNNNICFLKLYVKGMKTN